MKLVCRDYQEKANDALDQAWVDYQTALVVSATGTGKTFMFVAMIARAIALGVRCLILVDSTELVNQTREEIETILGVTADIEQAGQKAIINPDYRMPVVIATVQSLRSGSDDGKWKRYMSFKPTDFDRVFVDEAHLSITPTIIEIVEYFIKGNPNCRAAGYTATPKRGDGRSLEQLYQTCPFRYDIMDGINDGWLVPVRGQIVRCNSVKLADVKPRSGGDFSEEQIGEIMEAQQALIEQVAGLKKYCEGKRTIVFAARVRHAEIIASMLNDDNPGCARSVSGKTPKRERDHTIAEFKAGKIQYLINCAVLTKGFNSPEIQVVAICRPTKSWSLFTQCVGRGTRPLRGVVDGFDTVAERQVAIESSEKPHMTVLSFVGREGAMNLVGPADALSGDMDPPEVKTRAKELMEEGEMDTIDAIEQAREEIETERVERMENAKINVGDADLEISETDLFNDREFKLAQKGEIDIPPRRRLSYLHKLGYEPRETGTWPGEKVERAIKWSQDRERNGMSSYKQSKFIEKNCKQYTREDRLAMTKRQASSIVVSRMQEFKSKRKGA